MRPFRRALPKGAISAALLFLATQPQAALAGDVMAGRQIVADKCAVCHGLDGLAKIAEAPNLAGQNENYLLAQLTAFKTGARTNEQMSVVIQDLSDADMANLAAYYSAIQIKVEKVPGQ